MALVSGIGEREPQGPLEATRQNEYRASKNEYGAADLISCKWTPKNREQQQKNCHVILPQKPHEKKDKKSKKDRPPTSKKTWYYPSVNISIKLCEPSINIWPPLSAAEYKKHFKLLFLNKVSSVIQLHIYVEEKQYFDFVDFSIFHKEAAVLAPAIEKVARSLWWVSTRIKQAKYTHSSRIVKMRKWWHPLFTKPRVRVQK